MLDSIDSLAEGSLFEAPVTSPDDLEALARSQLEHAVDGVRRGLKVYESLRSLNDVIGTQYGDRVLYELLQNAHDAHDKDGCDGEIAIHLIIRSRSEGELRVANRGRGFTFENLDAIRNIGTSNKEIGESIGNKGLGFRSVEALTDDVQVFSQPSAAPADRFSGYCFRFASVPEILDRLGEIEAPSGVREKVASTIPRYLVAVAPPSQPPEVREYARQGFATVVCLPLRTAEAVDLARKQVLALDRPEAPLMLFLRRLAAIEMRIDEAGKSGSALDRTLRRKSQVLSELPSLGACTLEAVDLERAGRFLVVRRAIDKPMTLAAVERSIPHAPQLARWLEWQGEPEISLAIAEAGASVRSPRFYNFLAMDAAAVAPFAGFADAPFFADIDRRNLKVDLPLNDHLISQVADTCVGVALAAIQGHVQLSATAIVDLLAWDPVPSARVTAALQRRGGALRVSAIWPTQDGASTAWTALSAAIDWPEGKLRIFSPTRAAQAGAPVLPGSLGEARLGRIRKLAGHHNITLKPGGLQLAVWSAGVAQALSLSPRTRPADWTAFYAELISVFSHFGASLWNLRGKKILLGAQGELMEAHAVATEGVPPVYVRVAGLRGRRGKSADAPLPPSSLSRKLRFLSDAVVLPDPIVHALRTAGLLRVYDPVEVLANLDSTLGPTATDIRRRDALLWAFRVAKAGAAGLEEALKSAKLRVPTLGGWEVASQGSFSAGWTSTGQLLEAYLTEAAEISQDCVRARRRLLVAWADWPAAPDQTLAEWRRFLDRLGVRDGLQPVAGRLKRNGTYSAYWHNFIMSGVPSEGFDAQWAARMKGQWLQFPQTDYQVRGEAWRIPGQLEHHKLPDGSKLRLSDLVAAYLRDVGDRDFTFELGAYHKPRDWDQTTLATPLQVFVATGRWMAIYRGEEPSFHAPHECWAARTGRQPPRLVDRFTVDSTLGIPPILFDHRVGLRDWSDRASAAARLAALAKSVASLASGDRRDFRDYYRRAWADVVEGGFALEEGPIVVERAGALQALDGDAETPVTVYVTKEPFSFAARTLNDRNEPVLDIGDAKLDSAIKLLADTGRYYPLAAEEGGVRLRVDGAEFTPSGTNPLLVSTPGLDWLPDAAVLAYETLGDPLEIRNVSSLQVERRIRAVRIHRCQTIALWIGGKEIVATGTDRIQAFPHPDHPTLILAGDEPLTWSLLLAAAPALSKLMGSGVKSLEMLLLRLNQGADGVILTQPSHQRLANALGRGVELVREHFAAIDSGIERKVRAVSPIVHYVGGAELVEALRMVAEKQGPRFDLEAWLSNNAKDLNAAEVARVCAETEDFAQVRERLGLDFGRFNRSLIALGLPGLNNRADLERMYEVYLNELRADLVDRLRRRYFAEFQAWGSLATYVTQKALGFAPFNLAWLDEVASLDRDRVRTWVAARAEDTLGPDTAAGLQDLKVVLEANRKLLAKSLAGISAIIGAWRERHPEAGGGLWADGDMPALARSIEQHGGLDFEVIEEAQLPQLLSSLGMWPAGMKVTADLAELSLTMEDIRLERERAVIAKRESERARRSIIFAGSPIDPAGDGFELALAAAALKGLQDNPDWFARSRPPRLVPQATRDGGGAGGAGGPGGKAGGRAQPPEAVRRAMGLASELLVREYLRRRFPREMTDASWVSTNRATYHPDWEGDDTLGYDFRVVTSRNEWLFEVKSALDAGGEFEFTANELRVAGSAAFERKRRYRILYVPFVFDPAKWCVLPLGNPAAELSRHRFRVIRTGSVRYGFERR